MNQQHIFFQQFGVNPEVQQIKIDPKYLYNNMILELSNNWAFVRWLMCRHRENMLSNVDPLEQEWLNFILTNNIDVEKYQKDTEMFLTENLK